MLLGGCLCSLVASGGRVPTAGQRQQCARCFYTRCRGSAGQGDNVPASSGVPTRCEDEASMVPSPGGGLLDLKRKAMATRVWASKGIKARQARPGRSPEEGRVHSLPPPWAVDEGRCGRRRGVSRLVAASICHRQPTPTHPPPTARHAAMSPFRSCRVL